jgi:hypothetical protein
MVSGMDALGVAGLVDRSATYPPELCAEINRHVGDYPMGPNLFAYTDPSDMVEAALRTIDKKTAAAQYLYKAGLLERRAIPRFALAKSGV